jgi:ABC-type multidrug transport system permease subunit
MENEKLNSEYHNWSRHYDTMLWTVTSIIAGATGGLLVYAYSNEKLHWIVFVVGITFTVLAVFFAASFRAARNFVHSKMDKSDTEIVRGTPFWLFKQWPVFVLFWTAVLFAWIARLVELYPHKMELWLVLGGVCVVLILVLASFADKKTVCSKGGA